MNQSTAGMSTSVIRPTAAGIVGAVTMILLLIVAGCKDQNAQTPVPLDAMFVSRSASYYLLDEGLIVVDPESGSITPIDVWPSIIFQMADGKRTVSDITATLKKSYDQSPPDDLTEQVRATVFSLQLKGYVRTHDDPETLAAEFAAPTK